MEENFSMEWNIFSMDGKKIASMEYEKIVFHSIPYHALMGSAIILLRVCLMRNKFYFCYYLLTNKLRVKMLVKKAHALDSSFTNIHAIPSAITSQYDKYESLKRLCLRSVMELSTQGSKPTTRTQKNPRQRPRTNFPRTGPSRG